MTGYRNPPTEADRLRVACRVVPCREDSCKKPIIYLKNPKTGATVPVDAETVGAEDYHFDSARGHVSHYKTCTKPNRFSKRRPAMTLTNPSAPARVARTVLSPTAPRAAASASRTWARR